MEREQEWMVHRKKANKVNRHMRNRCVNGDIKIIEAKKVYENKKESVKRSISIALSEHSSTVMKEGIR